MFEEEAHATVCFIPAVKDVDSAAEVQKCG
jgi:hypothetical protein